MASECQPFGLKPETASQVQVLELPSALGSADILRLRGALEAANSVQPRARILVLRGSSECFCRGMDLSEIDLGRSGQPAPWERATEDFAQFIGLLRGQDTVTVAIVEGPALGGGVGLAADCDFVMATDAASFGLPELLFGLVPAIILPVLRERLGLLGAQRWAMLKTTWNAKEANAAGLVDQVTPAARLDVEVRRLLRSLLRSHPRGVAALKSLVRQTADMGFEQAVRCGQATLSSLLASEEVRADVITFRDFGFLPGEGES